MKILTHNIHSGYDFELAKTGHEFFALEAGKPWDTSVRPLPKNWHIIDKFSDMKFDCILISNAWEVFPQFKDVTAPMIFNIIADCSEGIFPSDIEERCSAVAFLAREVAERWTMKDPLKKVVIEMGIDETTFLGHIGETRDVLTVGHRIGKRWDKGHCPYVTVRFFIPLTLVGPGNEEIPGSIGMVSHKKLMDLYCHARAYFNPGPIIGISVAEAMIAGLPVVTFRPINLKDLIVDGINGFVVDTVDGAVMRINRLLDDPDLAFRMGCAARKSAMEVFGLKKFVDRWNGLFLKTAGKEQSLPEDLNFLASLS